MLYEKGSLLRMISLNTTHSKMLNKNIETAFITQLLLLIYYVIIYKIKKHTTYLQVAVIIMLPHNRK